MYKFEPKTLTLIVSKCILFFAHTFPSIVLSDSIPRTETLIRFASRVDLSVRFGSRSKQVIVENNIFPQFSQNTGLQIDENFQRRRSDRERERIPRQ